MKDDHSCRMGTIMAVVAVLLIHMERKAVGSMKPNIRNLFRGVGVSQSHLTGMSREIQ